ncbi:MAG: hypothetical protein ACRC7C_18200 [Beijerinckiaceae bacterium]
MTTSQAQGNVGFRGFFNNLTGVGNRSSAIELSSANQMREAGMRIMTDRNFDPRKANNFLQTYNASVSEWSGRTYSTNANFSRDAAGFSGTVQRTIPGLVNLGVTVATGGNLRAGAAAGAFTSGIYSGINETVGNRLNVSNRAINDAGGSTGRRGIGDLLMQGSTAITAPARFLGPAAGLNNPTTRQMITQVVKVAGFEAVRDTVASVGTRKLSGDLPKNYSAGDFVRELAGNAVTNGAFEGGGAAFKKLNSIVTRRTGVDLPGHAEATRGATTTRVSLGGGAVFTGVGLANLAGGAIEKLPKFLQAGPGAIVRDAIDPLRNIDSSFKVGLQMDWGTDGKLVKRAPVVPTAPDVSNPGANAGVPDVEIEKPKNRLRETLREAGQQGRSTLIGARSFVLNNVKNSVGSVISPVNTLIDRTPGSYNWIDEALNFDKFKLPERLGFNLSTAPTDSAFKQTNTHVNDVIKGLVGKDEGIMKKLVGAFLPSLDASEGISFDPAKALKNGQFERAANGSLAISGAVDNGTTVTLTKPLDIGYKRSVSVGIKPGSLVDVGTSNSFGKGMSRKYQLPAGTVMPKVVFDQISSGINSMSNFARKVSPGKGVGQVEIAVPISRNILQGKNHNVGPDFDNLLPANVNLNPSYVSLPTSMKNFLDVAPGLKPLEDVKSNKAGISVKTSLPFTLEVSLELAVEFSTNVDKRAELLAKLKEAGVTPGKADKMIDNLVRVIKLSVRDRDSRN